MGSVAPRLVCLRVVLEAMRPPLDHPLHGAVSRLCLGQATRVQARREGEDLVHVFVLQARPDPQTGAPLLGLPGRPSGERVSEAVVEWIRPEAPWAGPVRFGQHIPLALEPGRRGERSGLREAPISWAQIERGVVLECRARLVFPDARRIVLGGWGADPLDWTPTWSPARNGPLGSACAVGAAGLGALEPGLDTAGEGVASGWGPLAMPLGDPGATRIAVACGGEVLVARSGPALRRTNLRFRSYAQVGLVLEYLLCHAIDEGGARWIQTSSGWWEIRTGGVEGLLHLIRRTSPNPGA